MIPYEYTRARLEMLLAFNYDLYSRQSAERSVEGSGAGEVDIILPSQEGKGKRCTKTYTRGKAEAAYIQNIADVKSG